MTLELSNYKTWFRLRNLKIAAIIAAVVLIAWYIWHKNKEEKKDLLY